MRGVWGDVLPCDVFEVLVEVFGMPAYEHGVEQAVGHHLRIGEIDRWAFSQFFAQ